jgi:uncharacterized protein (TIGR04540 family)
MYEILINDNIFNKSLTTKQIAFYLKRYCDMYHCFQLSGKQFTLIILYFYSLNSTLINEDGFLNPTVSKIIGKNRSFTILLLLEKYFYPI